MSPEIDEFLGHITVQNTLTAILGIFVVKNILHYISNWVECGQYSGPFPLPFVGNLYDPHSWVLIKYLSKLKKKYGRIFRITVFNKPYLVITDPILVRRILSDVKTFPKGPDYDVTMVEFFGQGLVTSSGDVHKKDRAMMGKYFMRSSLGKHISMMHKVANDTIDGMMEPLLNKSSNIEPFFAVLALRVFMKFCCGCYLSPDPKREEFITHLVSEGSNGMGICVALGIPFWLPVPYVNKVKSVATELWKDLAPIVERRRQDLKNGPASDYDDPLTAMLESECTDAQLKDHMKTLVVAGHDTTAFFSSYLMFVLAKHPEVQERLRKECVESLAKGGGELNQELIFEMQYLQKVVQEVLRLYAIVPFLTRAVGTTTEIKESGVTLKKDQSLMIPMFLMNRDPELWTDPNDFNPDRFEGKGNEFTNARAGFFPFGYGVRTCIGNTLVHVETAVFTALILSRYTIKPAPGFKPIILSGVSLVTSNGINVILEKL